MKALYVSGRYSAHNHPIAGLIVESSRKSGGVRLKPDHPQYNDYVDAFTTAIDNDESEALCRALLN